MEKPGVYPINNFSNSRSLNDSKRIMFLFLVRSYSSNAEIIKNTQFKLTLVKVSFNQTNFQETNQNLETARAQVRFIVVA